MSPPRDTMCNSHAQQALERTVRLYPRYALTFNAYSGPLGNIESTPDKQQCVPNQDEGVSAGERTLFINATTNDALYHFWAFYQFDLSFEAV